MTKVIAIHGGPTGQPEPNEKTIQVLESWLEMAKSGEIIGVAMAGLCADGYSRYSLAGFIGGYSMLGALDVAKAEILGIVREA